VIVSWPPAIGKWHGLWPGDRQCFRVLPGLRTDVSSTGTG
jgi:hypothetical protein